jgi:hypothetical protein
MRLALLAVGLLVLAACAQPAPPPGKNAANKSDLYRFIEPTNGAAYSQGDARYYQNQQAPYSGAGGAPPRTK